MSMITRAPRETSEQAVRKDLRAYREALARRISQEGPGLVEQKADRIGRLETGRWVIRTLAGAEETGQELGSLLLEACALWLKAQDDMETALRAIAQADRAPDDVKSMLRENLESGLEMAARLQDQVDDAFEHGFVLKAKEISKFRLNLQFDVLRVGEILERMTPDGPFRQRAASLDKAPKKAVSRSRDNELSKPARPRVPRLRIPPHRSVPSECTPAGTGAGEKRRFSDGKVPWRRPFFWIALTLVGLVGWVAMHNARSRIPQASQEAVWPEDFHDLVMMEGVNEKQGVFFGTVTNRWSSLDEDQKLIQLRRLRSALAQKGYSEGFLTGPDNRRIVRWTRGEIILYTDPITPRG